MREVSDAGWRAGFTLWLRTWEQVPAGSLPDNEIALCRLAELGRDLKAWRKIANEALHGWFKCSDGLLYHKTVAEGVLEAWGKRTKAKVKGKAGADARWNSAGNSAGNSTSNSTSNGRGTGPASSRSIGTGNASAIARAMPGDGKGSRREVRSKPAKNLLTAREADELADFKKSILATYQAAGSMKFPDTHRAEVWISQGFKPDICLAVIGEILAKRPEISTLKYFDQPIDEAHKIEPKPNGGAPPKPDGALVNLGGGFLWDHQTIRKFLANYLERNDWYLPNRTEGDVSGLPPECFPDGWPKDARGAPRQGPQRKWGANLQSGAAS